MKAPAFQFYPSDWIRDTRSLSLAAKGAWIDLLSSMWFSQNRGVLSMTIVGYARMFGADAEQARRVIKELLEMQICDGNEDSNGTITLSNRRMVKEEKERQQTRFRVRAHREKSSNEDVTLPFNEDVTPPSSSSSSSSVQDSPNGEPVSEPATKRREAPNPEVRVFIDGWCSAYEAQFAAKYVVKGAKDGSNVKALLTASGLSADELLAVAKEAWRMPNDRQHWACSKSGAIPQFCEFFNQIRGELRQHTATDHRAAKAVRELPEDIKVKLL